MAIHGAFDAELLLAKVRENATIETETYESTTIYRVTPNLGTESRDASSRSNPAFALGVTLILTPIIANCVSARHCRES